MRWWLLLIKKSNPPRSTTCPRQEETERPSVVLFFTPNTKSFNNLLARRFAKKQLTRRSATTARASEHKIYTRAAPAANSSLEKRERLGRTVQHCYYHRRECVQQLFLFMDQINYKPIRGCQAEDSPGGGVKLFSNQKSYGRWEGPVWGRGGPAAGPSLCQRRAPRSRPVIIIATRERQKILLLSDWERERERER